MYSSLVRNAVIPLYDFATRNPTRRYMRDLEASQWFAPRKITEIQNRRLRALVRHAYRTVPYYHKLFRDRRLQTDDIKTIEDLDKLPVLARSDVQGNVSGLLSREYPRKNMVRGNTGGSTGEPLIFYTTFENRFWSTAARYLAWRWAGFEWGDRFTQLFGLPIDVEAYASIKAKLEGLLKRRFSFNSYRWSEADMEKLACRLANSKPQVIYGNAVPVAMLAKFIEDRDIKGVRAKAVVVDSNMLFQREVETVERVFQCRLWWNYHNRENGTFASECHLHDGYHLFSQNFIFEFVRKAQAVAPGEIANIVVTDLFNYAMPFIRYEVGDLGTYTDDVCPCGRGLHLMKELQGRRCDILVTDTGRLVMGPFYQFERFFDIAKIRHYQVVQQSRTETQVKIVPDEGYSERDTERIRNMVHFILGENMNVEITVVESIATSKSGKRRTVLRNFPIDFED